MNRSFSIRSNKSQSGAGGASSTAGRRGFSFTSLRGTIQQPELSRRLYKLIKSENTLVGAHETAGRERVSIAQQLSEWGEKTGDPAVSDVSDKLGVVLSELGEQEENYAHSLEDSRALLKRIRNTERSVQPSRDSRARIADEIGRLKAKEPQSAKLVILEQELVRAEAENLVAEAQLVNVTRKSLKEAYDAELAATIERAEKQIILARHGRRLLQLISDEAVVPGDRLPAYDGGPAGRQVLCDCEDDLRDWRPGYGLVSGQEQQPVDADAAVVKANTVVAPGAGAGDEEEKATPKSARVGKKRASPASQRTGEDVAVGGGGDGAASPVESQRPAGKESGRAELPQMDS